MNKKGIIFIFGIIIFVFLVIGTVSAFTQDNYQLVSSDLFKDVKDSECSSIILQLRNNESVASFRRDESNPADIFIVEESWDNISYIKQYKTSGGEFFQAIITENGYIIGVGGGTDGKYNKQIEEITSKMVLSENISEYIPNIQNILNGYKKGHFIIKAPNGDYDVVWPSGAYHGKLNEGQYICVPNLEKYSFKGNFSSSNPVEDSIKIAGKDIFGIDRRDIITYEYVNNDSGTFVEVFASNDDGSLKGSSSGNLYDDINYMGKLYKGNNLPNVPDKVHLGTYEFKQYQFWFDWFLDSISK